VAPCGVCEPCRRIADSRFVDVLEVDAASHNGVDFVRDLNEMVRYRPVEGRYKVVILDEAHMLSTSAFNALLKTLEEPPEHVKFLFATTEIQRMPATVLSRCQRFDLRRIEPEVMIAFLGKVAGEEGAEIEPDALALIARAAAGSVRDALSLLDQALAHGEGALSAAEARRLLGLADRSRGLDLFEKIMRGDAAGALAELSSQYAEGADPLAALAELAEISHWLSVVKIAAEAADDPTAPVAERARARAMAEALPRRALSRAWQMLLKGMEEARTAPNAMMAAEMAVIRLTHVADLPSPEDLVRRLMDEAPPPAPPETRPGAGGGSGGGPARAALRHAAPVASAAPQPRPQARAPESAAHLAAYDTFESVVALIRERRDAKLLVEVETHMRLVRYVPGRIEFAPGPRRAVLAAGRSDAPPERLDRRALGRLGGVGRRRARRGANHRRAPRGRSRRPARPGGGDAAGPRRPCAVPRRRDTRRTARGPCASGA
jgi:DNA polymerase-3 subunit gamma/tau